MSLDRDTLAPLAFAGHTIAQMAQETGESLYAVRRACRLLGLRPGPQPLPGKAVLGPLVAEGLRVHEVADRVRLSAPRAAEALDRAGLVPRIPPSREVLQRMLDAGLTRQQMAAELAMTRASVSTRLRQLELLT